MPPLPTEETNDLRSTIEASIGAAESGSTGAPASETAAPASGTAPASYLAPTPAAAPAPVAPGVAAPVPTPVGSIPPKEGAAPAPAAPAGTPAPVVDKAPGTWTPQARERWNEVHPDVRAEITRRERETSRAMTQSTDARRFQKEFQTAINPFMPFIVAQKSDPIKATVSMMQTAAALQTGTAGQKANVVASVIKQYGVDLRMLDGLLAGQGLPAEDAVNQRLEQLINQRTAPLMEQLQRFQQREQESAQLLDTEVDTELAAFAADPKNEFFDDVKGVMADLMEVDAKRGGNMGLTEAYRAATLLSEPVRLTLEGRKTSQSPAQKAHQVAQQARSGAFSIKPSDETGVASVHPGDSIRDSILYAMEKTSGR